MSQELSSADRRHELDSKGRNEADKNSAYHQLSTQHNTAQQLNVSDSGTQSSEYNSDAQRSMFNHYHQSFNDQRDEYTEQAFNQYEPQTLQSQTGDNVWLPNTEESSVPQSDSQPAAALEQKLPSKTYDYQKVQEGVPDVSDEEPCKEFERCGEGEKPVGTDNVILAAKEAEGALPETKPGFLETDKKITLGAETPEMMKLSQKIYKDRIKKDIIHARLKETKKKNRRISIDTSKRLNNENGKKDRVLKTQTGKKRLYDKHNLYDSEGAAKLDRAVNDVINRKKPIKRRKFSEADTSSKPELEFVRVKSKSKRYGRLKYEKETAYQKQTKKAYDKQVKKQDQKAFEKRIKGRLMFSRVKSVFDDDSIQTDETAADMSRMLKRGGRTAAFILRKKSRDLRDMRNPYDRLKYITERDQYHIAQKQRLVNKNAHIQEKQYIKEAAAKEERKRRKKEMQKARVEREGNFWRRTRNQFKMTKKSAEYRKHTVKRTIKTVTAIVSVLSIFLLSGLMALLFVMCLIQGAAEYYAEAVVQVDYGTMTDATEYYKNLEADLEEYLSDKTALENELRSDYGNDIYEFHYDICSFGFSANTILAYLAAKYNEFTLDDTVKEDLKEVFQEMYVLSISIRMENREIDGETEQKKICYVMLTRTELEEIVEGRLTDDQLKLYKSYKLTTGGQQVYGPVMREDWTNLISSNYGDRIHPITKVRTTHKGVDIAVPTGTKLYSAVKGTVTVARFSETAGNMVTVKNSTGWTVTFMHMDSIAVSVNQEVEKGDFIGYSGNTGNSTGPYLHLQVNDASGNTVNPIFIIPQTCAKINDE